MGLIPANDFCAPALMTIEKDVIMGCTDNNVESTCLGKCQWYKGTGETQAPKFHCVTKDRTAATYDATKDNCMNIDTEAACGNLAAKCEWKSVDEGTTTPTNTTDPTTEPTIPSGPTPLFTKEFCHPAAITDTTTEADFDACIQKDTATDCDIKATCKWSNGTDLIPKNDFCAPAELTDDVKLIMSCINAIGESVCAPPCKWRRGSQPAVQIPTEPATNDVVEISGPLFSKNFCHPPTRDNWETEAANCLQQDTEVTCQTAKCAWSTGKELTPSQDFCAPAEMTQDKQVFDQCTEVNTESLCLKGCNWYKGTGDNSGSNDTFEMCFPADMTNEEDMKTCAVIFQEADCQSPTCKWGSMDNIINDAKICMPNDITDQSIKDTCSALKTSDSCVAPCAFVTMEQLMGMADIKEVKCRPQLSEMGLINAHINCGTITSDVACNVNDNSCRWANATGDLPTDTTDPTDPTDPTNINFNCLPKNFADLSIEAAVQYCIMSQEEAKCTANTNCFWKDVAMTPVELFNQEWCHPIASELGEAKFIIKCSKLDQDACAKDAICSYGSLTDMLPTGAFCGVDVKFPYPEQISECMSLDKTGCANVKKNCQWYEPTGTPATDEKCGLKCIYQAAAIKSGVAGADAVCTGIEKDNCANVEQCQWITPTTPACEAPAPDTGNEPSKELNKCTHLESFNSNKTVVAACAKMDETACFTNMLTFINKNDNNLECIYNQCMVDTDCSLGAKCKTYSDDSAGICSGNKVPSSNDTNVCTHNNIFDRQTSIQERCAALKDIKSCEASDMNIFCRWNSKPVIPSTDIKTCTHTEDFSRSQAAVVKCSTIKDVQACEAAFECAFNYPPVEPSIEKGVCTHSFKFNDDRTTVDMCKKLQGDDCKVYGQGKCVLNECVNNFGEDKYPCPTSKEPYCVQSNGQFNPGQCSNNETQQIKCVPAVDNDAQDRDILLSCLVQNTEDICAFNEQCRWEGEKTQCHDTPGWTAFQGVQCSIFAGRYCADGNVKSLKYASSQFNNPAENCCACGKQIAEENSLPVVPVNPQVIYNECTNKPEDEGNWRIAEYCKQIGNDFLTCNIENSEYCSQKCGKGNERIQISLPVTSPQGLEKAIQANTGIQTLDLGKIFNQIATIEPKGTECGIGGFELFQDESGRQSLNGRRLQSSWSIDSANQQMKIDTTVAGTVSGFVSVQTLGDVPSNLVPFAISVCETPLIKVSATGIAGLVKPVYNLGESDGKVIIPKSAWGRFVKTQTCDVCSPNVDIIGAGLSTFGAVPQGLTFDEEENLIIDTTAGNDFNGAIVVSYEGDCADIQDQIYIPISFIVCGGESIASKTQKIDKFVFNVGKEEKDVIIDESQLTSFFTNSNPNCGIKAFSLTSDQKGTPINAKYANQIKFDSTTGKVEILNNINKAHVYKFFIQAESSGGTFAYKPMKIKVVDNLAPFFRGFKAANQRTLSKVKIVADPTETGNQIVTVKLPVAVDKEKNEIVYKLQYKKTKWIKKFSKVGNKYVLKIDKSKIKEADAGSFRIGITLRDDKYSITRLENSYILPINIDYITPAPVVEETKEANSTAANATATNADGTAATIDDATATADATTDDATAAATTDDATAAATTDDSTDATADDSTTSTDSTATAADSTSTDKTTAAEEKPKEKIVKSGGQLAGLKINLGGDTAAADAEPEKKEEVPAPPPIDTLSITDQITLQATPTAPPKATIEPLVNPESTAAPTASVNLDFAKIAKSLKLNKKNRKNKNKKNKKASAAGAAADAATPEDEPIEEAAPVEDLGPMKVKTGDMDASGGLPIKSNQPTVPLGITSSTDPKTGRRRMFVQNFYDHPVTGKRQLLGVSELDVSRDVVDLKFITETDQETNPIGYYLDLENWDENGIDIKINYTDPLMVGKGNDQVMTTLKNPDLFVSASSGEALPKDAATSIKFSPTQVPKDVSENKLNADAKQTNNAMIALIILQIVAQLALKGGMDDLWSMFFTLQIVCYLKFYGVIVPTNVNIYRDQFVKLVEFNMFNPQKAVQMVNPNFDLMDWIRGREIMVVNKAQEASVFNDLKIFILLAAVLVAILLTLVIGFVLTRACFPKTAEWIKNQLKSLKQRWTWNLSIRTIDISFIQVVITCGTQFSIWHSQSIFGDVTDQRWAFGLGIVVFLVPVLFSKILYSNGDKLQTKEVRDKFNNLYLDVHMNRNPSTKYYMPISMLRRILFVMIPSIFYQYPFLQLQVFLVMNTCYLFWYGASRPHIDKKRIAIELFNESMIMIFVYHLMVYTDFVTVNSMQFLMGYSNVVFFIVIAFVNIGLMIVKSVEKAKRKRRLDKLRVAHNKQMEAAYSAIDEERKYKIKNKDRRMLIRSKLDLRSMFNAKNANPMTQSIKDKIEAQQLANEKANLAQKIMERKEIESKLSAIPQEDVTAINDLKNRLDTIMEEGDDERLHQIEVKMKDIQSRQDLNKIQNESLQQFQGMAQDMLETELQDMKKNYLVDSEKKELFEIADATNADDCVSSSDDEGNQDKKGAEDKPIYGLANEDVPEDLRQWIATPEKFQAYKDKTEENDQVMVPTQLNL